MRRNAVFKILCISNNKNWSNVQFVQFSFSLCSAFSDSFEPDTD